MKSFCIMLVVLSVSLNIYAHSGKTDSYGCHKVKATGAYHCHKGKYDGKHFDSKEEGIQYFRKNKK